MLLLEFFVVGVKGHIYDGSAQELLRIKVSPGHWVVLSGPREQTGVGVSWETLRNHEASPLPSSCSWAEHSACHSGAAGFKSAPGSHLSARGSFPLQSKPYWDVHCWNLGEITELHF